MGFCKFFKLFLKAFRVVKAAHESGYDLSEILSPQRDIPQPVNVPSLPEVSFFERPVVPSIPECTIYTNYQDFKEFIISKHNYFFIDFNILFQCIDAVSYSYFKLLNNYSFYYQFKFDNCGNIAFELQRKIIFHRFEMLIDLLNNYSSQYLLIRYHFTYQDMYYYSVDIYDANLL